MIHPNYERRESEPSAAEREEIRCREIEQLEHDNYERLLGAAGNAIRAIPYDKVTNQTISTILAVLAAKAGQAGLVNVAEMIDFLESDVNK